VPSESRPALFPLLRTQQLGLTPLEHAGLRRPSAWILERTRPERYARTNPDVVTPSQITALVVQLAQIIVQEIPVALYRKQVLKRFDTLLKEANFLATSPSAPSNDISVLELSSNDPNDPNDHAPGHST
jgi:hypothetical protein